MTDVKPLVEEASYSDAAFRRLRRSVIVALAVVFVGLATWVVVDRGTGSALPSEV